MKINLLNQNNDSINRNLLFKVVDKYYSLNKNEKYLNITNKLLALSIEKNDTIHIAKSFYYTGNYHDDKSQFESAFSYYIKSEKLYQAINDTLMMGTLAVLKGGIFFDSGNFAESETEAIKALRLLSKTKNTNLVYNCYILL